MSASDGFAQTPSHVQPLRPDADITLTEVEQLQLKCIDCTYFLNKICTISKVSYCGLAVKIDELQGGKRASR